MKIFVRGPLLCSECTWWNCYAQKAVEEYVIPLMSKVKTAQQIQGVIIKQILSKILEIVKKN